MAIEFTVDHDHTYAGQEGIEQLIGWITFSVSTYPGDFRVREQGAGVARTMNIPSRRGWLATDGHLYKDQTLEQPCRLVGNDPSFNLKHLTYRADFDLTTILGDPIAMPHKFFPAPSTDTTLQLTKVISDPSQPVMEIRTKGYIEDILDVGGAGAEIFKTDTIEDAQTYLEIPGLIKELRTHIDLRDWTDVRDANWKSFLGATYTVGSPILDTSGCTDGVPLTSADVGKIIMCKIDGPVETWWKSSIVSVTNGVATLDAPITAGAGAFGRVRYGFDGTTAINNALAEVEAETFGPVDVYLGGSYRLTQLVIPEHVTLHGVRWNRQQVGQLRSGRTILRQLPGAEDDFVVFDVPNGVLTSNGFYDFELQGPELTVVGLDDATTGNGVAFRDTNGVPVMPIDGFHMERIHVYNFPESGFRCWGAIPFWVNECSAWFSGRYGFEHDPYGGNATYALHIQNFSGDWNNLGLLGFLNMRYNDSVFVTGLKSESHTDSDEANATRGGPNFQNNAIVFENCDRTTALVNGVSHSRVSRAETAPGPVIVIRDSGAEDRKPSLTFNGVHIHINEEDPPVDVSDAVTLRDEIDSVDLDRSVTSGFWPHQTVYRMCDINGNRIFQFAPTASAVDYLGVYNNTGGDAVGFYVGGDSPTVPIALSPKGGAAVQIGAITGVTPRIQPVGPDTDIGLNLQSKNAGTVQINGSAALYSGGALGTPASGTLTNCTGLPVTGISASTADALGVGSIELGHATANTLTASGGVLSIEGVEIPTVSSTSTLTNKSLTTPKIDSFKDINGATVMSSTATASAVNYVGFGNAATGGAPYLYVTGSDSAIPFYILSRGASAIHLRGNGSNGAAFIAQPVANGVNVVTATAGATGAAPSFSATGSDTNINLNLTGKGTGTVQANGNPVVSKVSVPSTATSAGVIGTVAFDASYVYCCTATNTWVRAPLASW